MVDILTNEEKKDEILEVKEPSLQGYSDQSYIDSGGKPRATAVGNLLYASATPVTAAVVGNTTLATFKVPAGTLGTSNVVRVKVMFSDADWDTVDAGVLSFLLNGNLWLALPNVEIAKGAAPGVQGWAEVIFFADGSPKAQKLHANVFFTQTGVNSSALVQAGDVGVNNALTENTNLDLTFEVRWTWGTRTAPTTVTMSSIIAEVIK